MGGSLKCWGCGANFAKGTGSITGTKCPACVRAEKADQAAQQRADSADRASQHAADRAEAQASAQRAAAAQAESEAQEAARRAQVHQAEGMRLAGLMAGSMTATAAETKECPECAEDVKIKARKCRFCGHAFADAAADIAAAEADAQAAQAKAMGAGLQSLFSESSSYLGVALRAGLSNAPGAHADTGAALCISFGEAPNRVKQMGMARGLMFDESLGTELESKVASRMEEVGRSIDAATVVVKTRLQGGMEQIDLQLRFESAPLGCYAFEGEVGDDDVIRYKTGYTKNTFGPVTGTLVRTSGFLLLSGQVPRTFEFLVAPGTLTLTAGMKLRSGEAWGKPGTFELAPHDVLVLDVDWLMERGLLSEKVAGYRVRSATRHAGSREAHVGRWGKRLQEGMALAAARAHGAGSFYSRDSSIQWLEAWQLQVPEDHDEVELGEGETVGAGEMSEGSSPSTSADEGPTGGDGGSIGSGIASMKKRGALKSELGALKVQLRSAITETESDASPLFAELAQTTEGHDADNAAHELVLKKTLAVDSQWKEADEAVAAATQRVEDSKRSLVALGTELGVAAVGAWEEGHIEMTTEMQPLAEIKEECSQLRDRYLELNHASGFFAVAKAKAEQLTIQARVSMAEGKLKSGTGDVGRELLENLREESVRCDSTSEVLGRVGAIRHELVDLAEAVEAAIANKEAQVPGWATELGCEELDAASLRAVVEGAQVEKKRLDDQRRIWQETGRLEAVLAAEEGLPPDNHPVCELLARISEKQEELETT
ncbi:MAG TPA: zinc ribbon domain-containing protein [Myxococcota bacterium]|nr:zinc ribbon domain-containing protein [Myxococcota bacterium]